MKTDPQVRFGSSVVVVEPGNEWFKLVRVSNGRGGLKVDKTVLKRNEDIESLAGPNFAKALGMADVAGEQVVVCLPRHAANVRLFDLPSGDHQEIADMVDLQIARQTPYSRDEIVFDYRLLPSDKDGYTRVMLVIVQTGLVRQKYRFLEECGFSVGLVTITTDGWLAAWQAGALSLSAAPSGATAVLDADWASSDLMILSGGVPLFSRSISAGLGVDLTPESFAQEIARALEPFRNENPSISVTSLAVTGAAAGNAALREALAVTLNVTVTAATGVEQLAERDGLTGDQRAVSLAGVLGAAAAAAGLQVNLVPESVRMRKDVMTKARQLTVTGVLIVAILGLLSIWVLSRLNRHQVYLDELNSRIKATTQDAMDVASKQKKVAIVAERLGVKVLPAKALVELCGVMDPGTVLTAVEISNASRLTCRGTTEGAVAATVRLVDAMERSPLFQNVKSTRTAAAGKDRTEFEITCDLEKGRP